MFFDFENSTTLSMMRNRTNWKTVLIYRRRKLMFVKFERLLSLKNWRGVEVEWSCAFNVIKFHLICYKKMFKIIIFISYWFDKLLLNNIIKYRNALSKKYIIKFWLERVQFIKWKLLKKIYEFSKINQNMNRKSQIVKYIKLISISIKNIYYLKRKIFPVRAERTLP